MSVRSIRPGKCRQRSLRAQKTDADEPRGQLDGPHVRLAQHPQVDRRVIAAQLVPRPRHKHQHTGEHQRVDPPGCWPIDAEEGEPAGDEQKADGEDAESHEVEGAARDGSRLGNAEEDGEEDQGDRDRRDHQGHGDVVVESREDPATAERTKDGAGLECHHE